jgi:hypothetical protein
MPKNVPDALTPQAIDDRLRACDHFTHGSGLFAHIPAGSVA